MLDIDDDLDEYQHQLIDAYNKIDSIQCEYDKLSKEVAALSETNKALQSKIKKLMIYVVASFVIIGILLFKPSEMSNVSTSLNAVQTTRSNVRANEETVYVTATGEKYHKANCRYVKGKSNLKSMDKSVAEEAGFDPCSVCKP